MTPLEQTIVNYTRVGLSNNNKVRVVVDSSTTADGYSVTETGIVLYNSSGVPALELLLENVGGDIKNGKAADVHYGANIPDNGNGVFVHGYAKISDGTNEYVKYTYNLYSTLGDVTYAPASGISQPITIMPLVYKKAMHFTGLISAFYRPALYPIYAENTATVENSKTIPIYSNGSNLTEYSFEGQCSQASTPTPSNPVEVECFGDLIASGDNAGKYDIPITSGGVAKHIILSEPLCKKDNYADSLKSEGVVTRRIKKYEITGQENWQWDDGTAYLYAADALISTNALCTHFSGVEVDSGNNISISASTFPSLADFKTFLATQYANGTPVTVYYVLATAKNEYLPPYNNLFDYKTAYSTYINANGEIEGNAYSISNVSNYFTADQIGKSITITAFAKTVLSSRVAIKTRINGVNKESNSITQDNSGLLKISVTPTSTSDYFCLTYGSGSLNNIYSWVGLNEGNNYIPTPTIPTSSGYSNIEIGTSLAPSKFTYDLGKMFVAKGQGKVRVNGEWV